MSECSENKFLLYFYAIYVIVSRTKKYLWAKFEKSNDAKLKSLRINIH